MAAAMSRVLLLVVGVLLAAGQLCGCVADGGGGFSVEFIHRDSAKSPFYDPSLTAHGRVIAAARRSTARAAALACRSHAAAPATAPAADDDDVHSTIISRSFEYLMAVNIGTPPTRMLAIADTGSDLVWLGCRNDSAADRPADGGGVDDDPPKVVYDPSASSTYARVDCDSEACQALSDASCDTSSNCRYLYSYGDGSQTRGLLAAETLSFDEGGRRHQLHVANLNFGCSTGIRGSFRADGLVGLGGGPVSLVSQLGTSASFPRKFSYCLVPYSVNASSVLNFGAHAAVSEPGAAAMPLVRSAVDAYYTVALDSVKVGRREVAAHRSSIIVDSGTTLTFLDRALLDPVVEELARKIKLPRVGSPEKLLELCYDVSGAPDADQVRTPDVTLVLGGGAEVTLRSENTFAIVQEGTMCLTLVAVSDQQPVSILGNLAQQNFHVGYDLEERTVTFAATDCAKSSSAS